MPVNTYQKRNRIPYQYAYVENILIIVHTCGKRCSVRAAQLGPLTEHSLSSHVRGGSRARVLACLLAGALPSLAGPASCGWLTRGAGKGHETQTQHMLTCLHTSRRSGAALEVGRPRRPRRLLRPTPAGSGEASEGKGVPTPVGLRARRGSFCRPLQRGLRGWNPGEGRRGWRPLAEGYLRPLPSCLGRPRRVMQGQILVLCNGNTATEKAFLGCETIAERNHFYIPMFEIPLPEKWPKSNPFPKN